MYKVIFKLKTITPLFMYGANKETPEIRASEFKGMMRFWWRASRFEDSIDKLFKEEQKIFGGSDERVGKSKVFLKVHFGKKSRTKILWDLIDYEERENRKGKVYKIPKENSEGIFYLLYSTVLPGHERKIFEPEEKFFIEIKSFNKRAFLHALSSFWLSIYLGGSGERARRGGGNLSVVKCEINLNDDEISSLPSFMPESEASLKEFLKENLSRAIKVINDGKDILNFIHDYSNVSILRSIISKDAKDLWTKSLNDVGKIFFEYRKDVKPRIFETAIFGLPIRHRNKKTTVLPSIRDSSRRASPLVFKIIEFKGKFYWVVYRFHGRFLPVNEKIVAKTSGQKNKYGSVDYSLLDDFWNKLKENGNETLLYMPERVEKIKEKLVKRGAKKMILFGSSSRGNTHEKSDIDLAVEGDLHFNDLNGNFDIVRLEKADRSLKEKIFKEGVIIHERKNY